MISALVCAAALQSVPPNIILILSDDHSTASISAYGSKINQTPAIDALAADGVRFDRYYTSNPLCAPSRAAILTGQYSHVNGKKDNASTFASESTFPNLLQKSGYATALVGKWHLKADPTGFDHWEVLPGQGSYYNPDFRSANGQHQEQGYVTDLIADKAISWLDGRPKDKPFFLCMWQKAPHRNWEPALRHLDLFDQPVPEPDDLFRDYSNLNSGAERAKMQIGRDMFAKYDLKVEFTEQRMNPLQAEAWDEHYRPFDASYLSLGDDPRVRTKENYQRFIKDYLRCVAALDESIGRIEGYLKANGLDQNTIVIYSSDQGFFLGEFGWYDKRWAYEPSARTPMIIRWPGIGATGASTDSLGCNVDLGPTILDMADIPTPPSMQGVSLAEMVKHPEADLRESVYGHFYESNDADHHVPKHMWLRTERFKVIYYYELKEWELFDLKRDPGEKVNLARHEKDRHLLRNMANLMQMEQKRLKEEPSMIRLVTEAIKRLP